MKKIDLGKTVSAISAQATGIFSGDADFSLSGTLGAVPTFEGSIISESLGLYKTEARSVSIPFRWSNGMFVISEGKGLFHEGNALFNGKVDPATMRWEGTLSVKGMDLENASERILEGTGEDLRKSRSHHAWKRHGRHARARLRQRADLGEGGFRLGLRVDQIGLQNREKSVFLRSSRASTWTDEASFSCPEADFPHLPETPSTATSRRAGPWDGTIPRST